MKEIMINLLSEKYKVYIKKGLLKDIGKRVSEIYNGKKIIIITDENVDRIYGDKVRESLVNSKFLVYKIVISPGEMSKSFNNLLGIYKKLLEYKATRSDLIISLGGGVVGDLAGFVSATYLRGIKYIQIPTSLLAQIDSSIGGKVAVDLEEGKNLVGAFYHPKAVFIDPSVLNTLDKRFLYDGMAEVIKYACIKDKELYYKLLNFKDDKELLDKMEDIIYSCCNIKKTIVEKDERDNGDRMILNFGHTIGHAIEKYFNFDKFTHGEAVALGMYLITKKSEKFNLTTKGTTDMIQKILNKYNLQHNIELKDKEKIIDIISLDKKSEGYYINLIFISEIGNSFIHKIKIQDLNTFL